MATYTLTMEKLKSEDDIKRLGTIIGSKNKDKGILLQKWQDWISKNEYYQNRKLRANGVLALLFKIKVDDVAEDFNIEKWAKATRMWFKQFTFEVNETSFIFEEAHSINKNGTTLFENIIILSPNQHGRLSYRDYAKKQVLRRLQKTYAVFMHDNYNISYIAPVMNANTKITGKNDQGLLFDNRDLPAKDNDESDEDYYKRVNLIFKSYREKYKAYAYKKHHAIEVLEEKQENQKAQQVIIKSEDSGKYKDEIAALKVELTRLKTENKQLQKRMQESLQAISDFKEQLKDYINITEAYGNMQSIRLGMRFASVIKYARRYYKESGNEKMHQLLDRMVTDGENYAKQNGVNI